MEIQIACGVLLCAFDLFDQIEQQGEVGGPGILLKLVHLFQVKNLIVVAADMDEQQIPDPPAEPGQCLDATIGFGEALSQGQDRADRFKCRGGDDGQTFFLPFAQGGDIQREGFADPAFGDKRQEPRIRRREFAYRVWANVLIAVGAGVLAFVGSRARLGSTAENAGALNAFPMPTPRLARKSNEMRAS